MIAPIALTGVELETPRFAESIEFYRAAFGLDVAATTSDTSALKARDAPEPAVVLHKGDTPRLRTISFAMADQGALTAARGELERRGLATSDAGPTAFTTVDPDGTGLRFHVGIDSSRDAHTPSDRPLFISHLVLNSRDPGRLTAFYTDVVGLKITDSYERGLLVFMRCDQPQHHCLGVSPGPVDGLNHFAMDCGGVDALMRAVSRMKNAGIAPIWGPGRHGPGGNVFCYFEDPNGFVPEFTCELLQIDDPEAWNPKEWARTPENGNVWLSGGPSPRAAELMSGSGLVA